MKKITTVAAAFTVLTSSLLPTSVLAQEGQGAGKLWIHVLSPQMKFARRRAGGGDCNTLRIV